MPRVLVNYVINVGTKRERANARGLAREFVRETIDKLITSMSFSVCVVSCARVARRRDVSFNQVFFPNIFQ